MKIHICAVNHPEWSTMEIFSAKSMPQLVEKIKNWAVQCVPQLQNANDFDAVRDILETEGMEVAYEEQELS